MTDYYSILGLPKSASIEEIKKTYRKKALDLHPDRNSSPEAENKFKELTKAYETLSDPEKKSIYDQFGENGKPTMNMGEMPNIFQHMFNQFGGAFNQFAININPEMTDIPIHISIPLKFIYIGKKNMTLPTIKRKGFCSICDGYGSLDKKDHNCTSCNGVGFTFRDIRIGPMIQRIQSSCSSCNGKRFDDSYDRCVNCNGSGFIEEPYNISFELLPGSIDPITIIGDGHATRKGHNKSRTNIVIHINCINEDSIYTRENNTLNLITIIKISLSEALCGFTKELEHLDGEKFSISVGEVCNPSSTIIVSNKGMKKADKIGDLKIKLEIEYPSYIINKKELWESINTNPYVEHITSDFVRIIQ
jgi:DnaJ-class molecular chaperone